jgi:hypothetical protein
MLSARAHFPPGKTTSVGAKSRASEGAFTLAVVAYGERKRNGNDAAFDLRASFIPLNGPAARMP